MNYHTALDVSLRSVSICIVDDDGAIQFEAKVHNYILVKLLTSVYFNQRILIDGF